MFFLVNRGEELSGQTKSLPEDRGGARRDTV
jgi:hypothetical protein